ncbi:MAG: DUF3810 domain-containing protein [Planctomycetota bacterium]
MTATELGRDRGGAAPQYPAQPGRARAIPYDGPTSHDGLRHWFRAFAPLLIGLLISLLARLVPQQVESLYSRTVYPLFAGVLDGGARAWSDRATGFDGAIQPSLSEVVVAVVAGIALLVLLHALFRDFGTLVRRAVWMFGVGYLCFIVLWGLNHARRPLAHTLSIEITEVSVEDLDRVAAYLADELAEALDEPHQPIDPVQLRERSAGAWREALDAEPALGWQRDPLVVTPFASVALASAGISGIFSPFTQEAHVAGHLPESDLAFTALHEIAHVQGWAREDEANYLAWRVGSRSSDHAFRRAALIHALWSVHSALRRSDPYLLAARREHLDPRIVELFKARAAFWAEERSYVVSSAVGAVNDAYLRTHGQPGVASYGRMVDLLVQELRGPANEGF